MRSFAILVLIAVSSRAPAVPIEPRDTGDEKWASVRGQIIFGGDKVPEPIATNARLQDGPQFIDAWVVNRRNKGVKNAFVWLAIDTKDRGIHMAADKIHPDLRKQPTSVLEMDVRGKQYFPNSIGIRAGQTLLFKNSSNEATNFKYQARLTVGNVLVNSGKSYEVDKLTAEATPMVIESNIHPWMKGYVRVFDHPCFALTDEDGKFEIRLAPVGKMRLWVWHPVSGFRDGARGRDGDPIEVKPRGTDVGPIKIRPLD
jgi:hypothetical protein